MLCDCLHLCVLERDLSVVCNIWYSSFSRSMGRKRSPRKKKIITHILKKNVKENESSILIKDNIMLEFI